MDFINVDIDETIERKDHNYQFEFESYLSQKDKIEEKMEDEQKICKYWSNGRCKYGTSCPYKHKHKKSVVCYYYMNSLCNKGDNCDFLHQYDYSKLPKCFFL